MTVCFSFGEPTFIVTGTDVLAGNRVTHGNIILKKFFINTKRNFVVLLSGGWMIDPSSSADPREILLCNLDASIEKKDTILAISKKIFNLLNKSYSDNDDVYINLQVCGFDGKMPRIYCFSNRSFDIRSARSFLTGAPDVLEFGKTEEFKNHLRRLECTIPHPEIIQDSVRKLMTQAIDYENKKAIARGENPKTGGGVNIVTVTQNEMGWSKPRFDSEDDPVRYGLQ